MRPIHALSALAVVILCLLFSPAHATQVIPRTPQELGSESTVVVRGTVGQVRSFWSPDHTKILTEVVLQVDEGFKGQASEEVRILQLGGVVDGVRVTVSGALHWRAKEEVLVFLEPYVAGAYQVSGFSQGKFAIHRDERTGEAYVSRGSLAGIEWVPTSSNKSQVHGVEVQRTSLDLFLDEALGRRQEGR